MRPQWLVGRIPRDMRRRRTAKQEEEEHRKYREKIGLPGPVDIWLATKLAAGPSASADSPLSPDYVLCSVHIERIPFPEPDDFFWDPDTYVLHLTITSAPRSFEEGAMESERRVVLGRYTGDPAARDAPDWVALPAGKAMVFRDSAAAVANLIRGAELCGNDMSAFAESLAAVRLDG